MMGLCIRYDSRLLLGFPLWVAVRCGGSDTLDRVLAAMHEF